MSRPHSKGLDYAVYLAARFLMGVVQMLSHETARRWAALLGRLVYHIDRRHRLVADENLRHAFPDYDERQRDRVIRAVYSHLCTLLVDFIFQQRRLHVHTFRRDFDFSRARPMVDAFLSGEPLLFITGHLGNWELASYAMGTIGFHTSVVARALDNPHLDDLFRRLREHSGQKVLDKNRDVEKIEQVLATGGALGTLADQDAGKRGVFVDFFGRPASTFKALALLALRYNARVVVAASLRRASGKHEAVVAEVIDSREFADRPDAIQALTQRYSHALERLIRADPEQYFWLHRRWKTPPRTPSRKAERPAA
jgi:KDO2-lipid IV(A) lauroyltransferase